MKKDTDNTMFYGALPHIFKFAEELRRNQTLSEKTLWDSLKGKQMGVKFRRQHPIKNYIADFYCHEKKLVIEIDGGYHYDAEQNEKDKYRSGDLNEFGITVIRFTNNNVTTNLDSVISKIKHEISI